VAALILPCGREGRKEGRKEGSQDWDAT
jgi:hypothetical protein